MERPVHAAAIATAALSIAGALAAQNCYQGSNQCFTFGPPMGTEVGKLDTDGLLEMRSERLTVEGDFRLRIRVAETRAGHPYAAGDQQATRGRIRMRFQLNEKISALGEYNFSETWAGSASYSDARVGENFDGVSQFNVRAEDVFGFEEDVLIGRSQYILGNGLIIGSCDFLQRPGTFTGVWVHRKVAGHDLEVFVFDDYGPLQAEHPGTRYVGGTANFDLAEPTGEIVGAIKPYYLAGTGDGDLPSEDAWLGIDGVGSITDCLTWNVEWANRFVDGGEDRMGWRGRLTQSLKWFDEVFQSASLVFTDADGKLDVGNPADFNTAGLVHQYGGAWRSDLQTWQLGLHFLPHERVTFDAWFLTFDRRGTAIQQGEFEVDLLLRAELQSGVYLAGGYGIDDDHRQVGFMQITVNF